MIAISQSEIAAFTRCLRRWLVTYDLGYQPASEPATGNRILGIRCHTALEGKYGYGLDPVAVIRLLYLIEQNRHADEPEVVAALEAEHDMANAMISGHEQWLEESGEDADMMVVAAEADVQVPLPGVEGVVLRARMDQVNVRKSDGALAFMDYKTAANFEKHAILERDPQMPFYCLVQQLSVAGRENPPLVDGGQITTLRRVKRTAKASPPFYQRDRFHYNPAKIEATLRKAQGTARRIVAARSVLDQAYAAGGALEVIERIQQMDFPPTPLLDCDWSCPLASGLCAAMDDGSDWAGILTQSGAWVQGDPYAHYSADPLREIRAELAKL